MITTYLPFTEEVIVGFTVDAIVGSTPVSVVEVSAVATCGVFTNCDTECIAGDINVHIYFVLLGDTIFMIALDDSRVFAALDEFLFISPRGDLTFSIAADDSTIVFALNDASRGAAVL